MKRIAFLTDVHLNEQLPIDNNVNPKANLKIVLDDLQDKKITEIIFGGDIGEASAHDYFFETLQKFSLKLILGNHDTFQNVRNHFNPNSEKHELYYKHEDNHFQYIYLDSSSNELSNNQLNWLKTELNESKKLVLFVHHPVLEIDTPVDKLYPLKNREELKLILLNFNNNVTLFCGHYHMNDEQNYKNITQIVTQSLSFQIIKKANEIEIDNANFGYRIIEIENDTITTQIVSFKS